MSRAPTSPDANTEMLNPGGTTRSESGATGAAGACPWVTIDMNPSTSIAASGSRLLPQLFIRPTLVRTDVQYVARE